MRTMTAFSEYVSAHYRAEVCQGLSDLRITDRYGDVYATEYVRVGHTPDDEPLIYLDNGEYIFACDVVSVDGVGE